MAKNGDEIMELRVLQYFLAVAREQSISAAAASLYLSQPTLSRQLRDLEEELGKPLFIRGKRKITLTEEGMILRKRAEEIISLVRKAEDEISVSDETVSGGVYIGAGETDAIRYIAKAAKAVQNKYPEVHFHIASGDAADVTERLDKGLIDFGILIGNIDTARYNSMEIPAKDIWGVLMRKDSELAEKESITAEDLWDKPLIVPRQAVQRNEFKQMMKCELSSLNITATCNLIYNGSKMVEEGMGYAITLDKLINCTGSEICFKPITPQFTAGMSIVWKKYQVFSKASEKFIEALKDIQAVKHSL